MIIFDRAERGLDLTGVEFNTTLPPLPKFVARAPLPF